MRIKAIGVTAALTLGAACGSSTNSGTLDQRSQGTWNLTGLTCDTTDLASFLGGSFSMSVAISGSSYSLSRSTNGCTLTDQGTITFNEAASTVVISPAGPPTCAPAACDSDCNSSGAGPSDTINVSVFGSSMVITASGTTFPNNVCEGFSGANPPGKATFTKQ